MTATQPLPAIAHRPRREEKVGHPGLDRLTRLATLAFEGASAVLTLVDENGRGPESVSDHSGGAPRGATSFCRLVLRDGIALAVPDVSRHPLVRGGSVSPRAGLGAYLGMPLRGADGRVLGALCIVSEHPRAWTPRDRSLLAELAASVTSEIELRRRTHALDATTRRLAEQQEYLDSLVQGLDAIVWEADPETGQFTFVSRHAERVLGYPLERWRRPGFWMEALHPDDRADARAQRAASIARLDDHQMEYRMVAADGRTIWLHDFARMHADPTGLTGRLRGVMVDITVRRQEREALREARDQLETLLGGLDEIVYSITPDLFERLYLNRAVERIFGRPIEDFIAHPRCWLEAVHPDDLPGLREALRRIPATGDGLKADYRILRPDGTVRWLRDRATMVRDALGRPVRLDGIAHDVTDSRAAPEVEPAPELAYEPPAAAPRDMPRPG